MTAMSPERLALALAAVALAFAATAIHALLPADHPPTPHPTPIARVAPTQAPPMFGARIDDALELHEAFDDVADLGIWHTDPDPGIDGGDEHAASALPIQLGGPGWSAVVTVPHR
jgi:hypothetical protein